jgi:hypothetical protein
MRRSRDLAFKRDRESKLQSVMSNPDGRRETARTTSSSSSSVTSGSSLFTSQRPSSRSTTVMLPQNNLVSKNSKSSSQSSSQSSKSKFFDEEEDEDVEPSFDEHDDYEENNKFEDEDEDDAEEEEVVVVKKHQPKTTGRQSSKNVEKMEKMEKMEKTEESAKSKKVQKQQTQRKTKQDSEVSKVSKVETKKDEKYEEHDEHEDEQQHEESGRKRRQNIVSKTILSKLLQESGIEGVSSDVYGFIIEEMQFFINDVIRILGNTTNGEELVVRESDLKFLGDKSKAVGHLDVKSFEKVYRIVASELETNAEFSSEAFKTLGKLTEIHVVQFLRKAGNVIKFYGRKRLTVKDLELLKEMLEDEK